MRTKDELKKTFIESTLKTTSNNINSSKQLLINNFKYLNLKLVIRAVEKKDIIYIEFIHIIRNKVNIKHEIIKDTRMNDKRLFKTVMDIILNYLIIHIRTLSYSTVYYINTINFINILDREYINKYIKEFFQKRKKENKEDEE